MDLALGTTFLAISMMLATFNIAPAHDADGRAIKPDGKFTTGLISHPEPFKYSVTPRDAQAIALIRSVMEEHPLEKGDADEVKEL